VGADRLGECLDLLVPSRFSSISAKKLFEGTLVSSISVDTVGEATDASGLRCSLESGRSVLPTLPCTRIPRFRRASFSPFAASSSGAGA
jgi:hypothetical protein